MTYSDNSDSSGPPPSLLPYEKWFEEAYRMVMLKALEFAAPDSLPGNHSFYLTFKTDYPGVNIPTHLKTKYPEEMTIVLQHQFWDLTVNHDKKQVSVGLSFNGINSVLTIPFGSITRFADPSINLVFGFTPLPTRLSLIEPDSHPATGSETENKAKKEDQDQSQVIRLDAFRKKTD